MVDSEKPVLVVQSSHSKNAISKMAHQTQFDFGTIAKYEEIIKKSTVKCAEMRNSMPS